MAEGSDASAETTAPSGVVSGDLLVLCVHSSGVTITTPTGWTQATTARNWFGAYRTSVFYRVADGTGDDTPTVTVTNAKWAAAMYRVDGQHATPIDATFDNNGDNASSPYIIDDVSITDDGSLLILAGMCQFGSSAGPDLTSDGYGVPDAEVSDDSSATWHGSFDSGTDGGLTLTFTGSIRGGTILVAIRPAAGGGPTITPYHQATETDSAFPINRIKAQLLGLSSEQDVSQVMSHLKSLASGLASEQDLVPSLEATKTRLLGLPTEQDVSQSVSRLKSLTSGLSSEQDISLPFGAGVTRVVSLTSEQDFSQPMSRLKGLTSGLTSEQDIAFISGRSKDRLIGLPSEQDISLNAILDKSWATNQSIEVDSASIFDFSHLVFLSPAFETELAFPLISFGLFIFSIRPINQVLLTGDASDAKVSFGEATGSRVSSGEAFGEKIL